MNLQEWQAARRFPLTLPSGLEVVLRKANLRRLVTGGQIPKPLLGMLKDLQDRNKDTSLELDGFAALMEHYEDLPVLDQLQGVIVKASMLEPLVADVADETHMAIGDLDPEDVDAIFNFATQGAKAIAPFSEQSGRSENSGFAGDAIPSDAGDVAGDIKRRLAGISGESSGDGAVQQSGVGQHATKHVSDSG